ncbi:MAG TPA: AAA family ATPase [Candidatus Deferrimicrobium sp.]|nr:AAA family ATPase [Candidatus Deferrimicrobium sp.]
MGNEPLQINDKEKLKMFLDVLRDAVELNNYVNAYKILADARDFVMGILLSQKSYQELESFFKKNLDLKLNNLGFIDISGKILSTTFWAMVSSGNLALKGPPGVGKSFFSKVILPDLWICDGIKPKVITIQPDRNMDIASLVADRGIKKGETVVEEGQIADAVNLANKGQKVILVLEEINQWPPKVLKDLNDFLEERKLERKIAGKIIKLECPKENLFIIGNYNPEGYTLGEDDTGSVSSRFIFCDLPFPSKDDLQKIIDVNISDREFSQTSIGDEIKRRPTKPFLRSMSDICYSLRSSIEAGELGPLAMPIGTRHLINFSKALINNNLISDTIYKALVDPILEKYVREGPLTNVDPNTYQEYVRTVFKTVKQIIGTIDPAVNEKSLDSLQKGLNISISDLFQFQGKKPYEITIRKGSIVSKKKPSISQLKAVKAESQVNIEEESEKLGGQQVQNLSEAKILEPLKKPTEVLASSEVTTEKEESKITNSNIKPVEQPESKIIDTSAAIPNKKIEIGTKAKPIKKARKASPELHCLKCGANMSLAIDSRNKKNLICDNPDCRNILMIPQYGEIHVLPNICKRCTSTILQITRRHGNIVHICPVCWRSSEVSGPCENCSYFKNCF